MLLAGVRAMAQLQGARMADQDTRGQMAFPRMGEGSEMAPEGCTAGESLALGPVVYVCGSPLPALPQWPEQRDVRHLKTYASG